MNVWRSLAWQFVTHIHIHIWYNINAVLVCGLHCLPDTSLFSMQSSTFYSLLYFRLLFIAYQALSGNRPLQSQFKIYFLYSQQHSRRRSNATQYNTTQQFKLEYNTIIYEVVTIIKINFEISSSSASESTLSLLTLLGDLAIIFMLVVVLVSFRSYR